MVGRVTIVAALLAAAFTAPAGWVTSASFTGSTAAGSGFAASPTFPSYSASVQGDSPLLYHRMEEPAGKITAADSSGNGRVGVYGPRFFAGNLGFMLPLDDGSGGTARDLSGDATVQDATLSGATWTTGRSGGALAFDGSSSAATAAPVVDTSASFSVSAWVYLPSSYNAATTYTAVSQGSDNVSGFALQYRAASGTWAFAVPQSDNGAAAVDVATATAGVATDTWTHLVGVYDSSYPRVLLYVNGRPQNAVAHNAAWNSTQALRVGTDQAGNFWPSGGKVDEVRVYRAAINDAGAAELAAGVTDGARTDWTFDEGSGSNAADRSGAVNTGTLGAGATWVAGRSGSGVSLSGTSTGYVGGARSAVRTDQSYTITAWAYLTSAAANATVVSQAGTVSSGFDLQYAKVPNAWRLLVTDSDAAGPATTVANGTVAGLNTWTHLAAVHDSAADQIHIYVNGSLVGSSAFAAAWHADGALQVGRLWWSGGWADHFPGVVDDVRAYPRALSAPEITNVHQLRGVGNSTLGVSGALQGPQQGDTARTAGAFGGRNGYNTTQFTNPAGFTLECWFRAGGVTGSLRGWTMLSFGTIPAGNNSGAGQVMDRKLYLSTSGNVGFAPVTTATGIATSGTNYLDGAWHHVAATLDPSAGAALYVDGRLAASGAYVAPGNYSGYWRWGGDTWNADVLADYFLGSLDEVAVYGSALSAQQIARHYYANH
jgi:hypothetical protein